MQSQGTLLAALPLVSQAYCVRLRIEIKVNCKNNFIWQETSVVKSWKPDETLGAIPSSGPILIMPWYGSNWSSPQIVSCVALWEQRSRYPQDRHQFFNVALIDKLLANKSMCKAKSIYGGFSEFFFQATVCQYGSCIMYTILHCVYWK